MFVPVGTPGGSWPNPNDKQNCQNAFSQVDMSCQSNPNSDKVACSDYPVVYCDGSLQSSGDLNFGGCISNAVAYSSDECISPRTVASNGAYLCGGNLDPCVEKEKTGMNCSSLAPLNIWNATNVCYPIH